MRTWKLFSVYAAFFGAAATFGSGCINVDYPSVAFRCNPTKGDGACPDGYQCCSDDPSVAASGERIFSDIATNMLSSSGMCVEPGGGTGLLQNGCPVPCNPTWTNQDIASVCGPNTICCQTTAVEPEDCIYDPDISCFRPVTGADASGSERTDCPVSELAGLLQATSYDVGLARCSSPWTRDAHVTHQSPAVGSPTSGCSLFAGGDDSKFNECVASLSVADQRGFCLLRDPANGVNACPSDLSNEQKIANGIELDACTQMNIDMNLSCG